MHVISDLLGKVHQSECLAFLKQMPDNGVDAICTDPPYGLSDQKQSDIVDCLTAWLKGEDYAPDKCGFMSRKWDAWVPSPSVWKECYRVLKPGGHLLAFAGTRTQDLMALSLRLAGFTFRETVIWGHAQGFPKSLNLGHGMGTALKPSYEPILLFRKAVEGTIAENVAKWGTGGLNIDRCRIKTEESLSGGSATSKRIKPITGDVRQGAALGMFATGAKRKEEWVQPVGRWPANLLLAHSPACRCLGYGVYASQERAFRVSVGDEDGMETTEVWECVDGCPIKQFPQSAGQQGDVAGDEPSHTGDENTTCYGEYGRIPTPKRGDSGSAARFFKCFPAEQPDAQESHFIYAPKASTADRNAGCEKLQRQTAGEMTGGRQEGSAGLNNPRAGAGRTSGGTNSHPTVKSTALMSYLVKLITPPKGIVLDPFAGSGSTGKAAILEGFKFIGIEQDEHYVEIANARLAHARNSLGLLAEDE